MKCLEVEQERQYRTQWQDFFSKNLQYKQPYIINGKYFQRLRDDESQAYDPDADAYNQ